MYLYEGMVFLRSGVTRDCLEWLWKVPVDRKRFIMVVIIVAEICFRIKGIWSRSHCLLREVSKSLAISLIDAEGKDDKNLGVRMRFGGLEWGGIVKGLDESLRQRLETLSKKSDAQDSAKDGLGIVDGSEVVRLWFIQEFMFFPEEMWVGD